MDIFGLNYIGDEECIQGAAANQPGLKENAEKADANNNTVYLIDSSEVTLQNVQVEASEFDNSFNERSLLQPLAPSGSEISLSVLSEFDNSFHEPSDSEISIVAAEITVLSECDEKSLLQPLAPPDSEISFSVLSEFDNSFYQNSLEQPLAPSDSETGIVTIAPVIDINEHNYAFTCTNANNNIAVSEESDGIHQFDKEWHENTLQCNICKKSYKSKSSLKRHTNRHNLTKDKKCIRCYKTFHTNYDLNEHMKGHVGKLFNCKYCERAFKTRGGLNTHLKCHEGRFSLYCDICGKGFNYNSDFDEHRNSHSNSKPYKCEICLKSYGKRSNLSRHMTTCGKIARPFSCRMCGKSFKAKRYLAEHSKGHDNPERYQCAICGTFYKYVSSFHKHIKKSGHTQ